MIPVIVPGYTGRYLRINLTKSNISIEENEEHLLQKYIGGAGLGAYYLYQEVSPLTDCWDSKNSLFFFTGPLAATRIPGSGTFSVSTKGCLTGGATSSQANGFWGAYLKLCGFDGIIVQGVADKLVYIYVHDNIAEIKDADHLMGKDTHETEDMIKEELGYKKSEMSVACIGPAGEHLVRFAAIVADGGHVAGHNGTGAVMGSKKLKAIAVARGNHSILLHNRDTVSALAKDIIERSRKESPRRFNYGTLPTYQRSAQVGTLPIKNYTTNIYPEPEKLFQFSPEYIRGHFEPKPTPCWACQLHHCHESRITEGSYQGMVVQEPEYECFSAMGSQIGNMEVASAMMLTDVVDRLGLEMNETGWVMGLSIECYEKGIFTDNDTDGLKLNWGNVEAVKQMLMKIAYREGLGNILAEGAKRASYNIGGEAPNMAIYTLKGNTPRGYDFRTFWLEMFDTATSGNGTIEARAFPSAPVGIFDRQLTVSSTVTGKERLDFVDTLGICGMPANFDLNPLVEALNAVTGWHFSLSDALNVSLRLVNLMRVYNSRCGHTRNMERPSPRLGSAPQDGPSRGQTFVPFLDNMLDQFYEQMGWEKSTGLPLPETLTKLGLAEVIKDIW